MTEAKPAVLPTDWGTLMRQSAVYIDAARLAACFDDEFSPELAERLRGASRLQGRLSDLISKRYALAAPVAEDAITDIDRRISLSPVERLVDLIRRAGAIYWANAIANVVLAEEVRWLHEQLGEALCAFALANRDLSRSGEVLEPLKGASERAIEDGKRCFAAWCQSLPVAVGARVWLKLPTTWELDGGLAEPFAEIGPSIVRRASS